MHSTTEAAVRSLRAKIVHEVETLAKMERTFELEYFKKKCRFAIQDVEAADSMFLRPMETETWRTPADELRTFSCAGLSYLQTASNAGATRSIVWGLIVMVAVIVLIDQIVWRPIIAWSEK